MYFRERVLRRECLVGTHLSMGEVYAADIFARAGYDYIWVDTEHSVIDYRELLACVTVIRQSGTAVIVRAHTGDHAHTKRILEMGVDGIVFPNVETPLQAEEAVRSCLYPPAGFRGFGPLGAAGYGLVPQEEVLAQAENICILVQIESQTAVENMAEIAKNKRIDGYILGPCDLSGSIGCLGEICREENLTLARQVVETAEKYDRCAGISLGTTDRQEQMFWSQMGYRMMSAGADYVYMCEGAARNLQQMRKVMEESEMANQEK